QRWAVRQSKTGLPVRWPSSSRPQTYYRDHAVRRILLLLFLLLLLWLGIKAWQSYHSSPRIAIKSINDVINVVTHDRAVLGRQLLAGQLAPDEYLARVRDRSRKLHNAQTNSSWLGVLTKAARDGALVPENIDNCPDPPPLAATDDHGCPQPGPLPPAPSRQDIERAKHAMRVAISPPCQDARPPSSSTPLLVGIDRNDPDSFLIAVSKVNKQAGKCPVFYDIRIRSQRSSFFAQRKSASHFYFVFRAAENVDHSGAAQYRNVFRVRKQSVSNWIDLFAVAIEP